MPPSKAGKGSIRMSGFIDFPSANRDPLLSPSLVIDRGLVRRNLDQMIATVRGPERLRPHVKTHKMPALVRLCEEQGVSRHKCATIAEADMAAAAGATDVLIGYPVVGPNAGRSGAARPHVSQYHIPGYGR